MSLPKPPRPPPPPRPMLGWEVFSCKWHFCVNINPIISNFLRNAFENSRGNTLSSWSKARISARVWPLSRFLSPWCVLRVLVHTCLVSCPHSLSLQWLCSGGACCWDPGMTACFWSVPSFTYPGLQQPGCTMCPLERAFLSSQGSPGNSSRELTGAWRPLIWGDWP